MRWVKMAYVYRKSKGERHDQLERWQTTVGALAGALLLALMAGAGFLLADRTVPPQHLSWKPLKLDQPVGVATAPKVSSQGAQSCRQVLASGGVTVQNVPDRTEGDGDMCRLTDAVTVIGGASLLKPAPAVMTCREALAYALWERQVVQPAAMAAFGVKVASMDQYGTYVCRRRYGRADQPVSEHAFGNALDVGAFHLADGRTVTVERDWSGAGAEGRFLHQVRDGACGVFQTVLSPDYNAEHHNHLHLDMGRSKDCQ